MKKIAYKPRICDSPWRRKVLLAMKLTAFFLFTGFSAVTAINSHAQAGKVTLNMENASLSSVFDEIEAQTSYYLFYKKDVIDDQRTVSINVEKEELSNVLNQLLANDNVSYQVVDNSIVIVPRSMKSEISQQDGTKVTGTVTDENGTPMPGVNIMIEGTSEGTVTNANGEFSLKVPDSDASLVFTYIGFEKKVIDISGQEKINVQMAPDVSELDEIVVVGYGSLEKKKITSSVSSMDEEDLMVGLAGDALMAVQGKVPGLSIQSTNGTSPNASTSIQLRGVASVLAGQNPLIVIDGVPGGSLNSVNREDIKSIDVLKDASAGAIYGTRAAAGVILITTKNGKAGPVSVTYTGELTTETIRRKPEVLSAEEFLENDLGKDYGHKTDWYDEVTVDNPLSQRHHLSVSGGTENSKVYASVIHRDQEGIAISDTRKETGGRLNVEFDLFDDIVELAANFDYRETNSTFSHNGIFNQALKLNPTRTPYDDSKVHGLNVWTGGWENYNPVADIKLRDDGSEYKDLLGNATLRIHLHENVTTQAMVSIRENQWRSVYYRSALHKASLDDNVDGYASQDYGQNNDKTFEWQVDYENEFGNHSLDGVAGYSWQEFNGDGFNMNNSDFPVDGLNAWDMSSGTYLSEGKAWMDSWKDPRERLIAFFGRVNYDYMDKYLLTLSGRYEGSSKFYKDNRWGMFPAVSVGWRISDESFMSGLSFLNNLMVRAGYGVTGNQNFSPGAANRMYAADIWWLINGNWILTYGSAHNQNKDLHWEEKKEFNLGVDFSVFDHKLTGKFDIYDRNVDGMIYDVSVSVPPAVHDKTTKNVGSLSNKGWEAELTWNAINQSDLKYSTTLMASRNTSTLESLSGSQTYWDRVYFPAPGSPGSAVRLYPGEEIGQFFVWKHAGFTEEGNWMLYDENGEAFDVTEKTKSIDDKQFVGNALPDVMLSWNHSLQWKQFEVSALFTSWLGHDIFNTINMYYSLPNVDEQNVLKQAFDEHKNITGEKELCDYWIENGDFLKLKTLTVRYYLDVENIPYVKNANVYLTGNNLFTITNYSGMDPESNINGLDPGFEWHDNTYPQTRLFTLGVQLKF